MVLRGALSTVLVLLGMLSSACGGGSGGGPADDVIGGPTGGSSVLTASFEADQPTPGPNTAAMAQSSYAGDVLYVDVNVTDTSGIASASMDLTFNPARVEFVDWSGGNVFPPCGGSMQCWVEVQSDRLVIALVPFGELGDGLTVSGTKKLIRLRFRATTSGSSRLGFERMALRDPEVDDIPGVSWYGGAVTAE